LRIGRESPVQAIKPAGRRLRRNAPPHNAARCKPKMRQFTPAIFALALAALSAGCNRSRQPSYFVYVTNEASGDLTVIDPSQPTAVATIPLGKRPRGIHGSGGLLYVTLSGSPFAPPGVDESTLPPPDKSADAIGVVDPGQNKLVRKIYAGSDPE